MPLLNRHRLHRSRGARVREYALDGLPLVILENEVFRLGFLAGKGADLVEWMVKPLDIDLAWIAPGGISNPARCATLAPDPAAAFMDSYPGGWQTVFPHGSIPAHVHGAPYGLHGEAALLPWDATLIEDDPDAVEVAFRVRLQRIPFSIERRVRLASGEAAFTVTETVANESDQPLAVNWGQHITFGPPFLAPGCRILTPDALTMRQHPIAPGEPRRAAFPGELPWPLVPAAPAPPAPPAAQQSATPTVPPAPPATPQRGPVSPAGPTGPAGPGSARAPRGPIGRSGPHPASPLAAETSPPAIQQHPQPQPPAIDLSLTPDFGAPGEMLYLSGFTSGAWIAIENPDIDLTAHIAWDGDLLPWCWVWQEFGATTDWPWHGRAYVVGLEPFAGPPPNANLGPTPGREPLTFAPGERKTLHLRARASQSE